MTSELRVDKIVPTSGVPTGGGGGVIQIVEVGHTNEHTITQTNASSPQQIFSAQLHQNFQRVK